MKRFSTFYAYGGNAHRCGWVPAAGLLVAWVVIFAQDARSETMAGEERTGIPILLTLEAAQHCALMENPSLQGVEVRVRQAGERVRQARSAYYPRVDVEWTATHTQLPDRTVREARESIIAGGVSALRRTASTGEMPFLAIAGSTLGTLQSTLRAYEAVPESTDRYALRLSVGYVLFNGFARKHTHALARFGEQETEAARQEARRMILEAVAQTYYGAQLARERLQIAASDRGFNDRLLTEARARLRVGSAAVSETLNFEVRLRASEAQKLAAEQDLELACIALASLMGLPEGGLPPGTEMAPLPEPGEAELAEPEFALLYDRALALRPDLERARQGTARAEANVGLQRSAYYPSVSVFAAKDAVRTDHSRFESDDTATTVGVTVSQNLFAGGRNRAAVAEARYAHTEARAQLKQAEIDAATDLREALSRLETARRLLRLQQENAGFVARNRDMAEKEFSAGQSSLALLNQAQRDLVEAQGNLALARASLYAAWHALRTATGETLAGFPEK